MKENIKLKSLPVVIILSATLFCGIEKAYAQNGVQERIDYINKYKDLAIKQMKQYKIPASITLAQGCLESGNGKSELAKKSNNHFGIKCHNDWEGKSLTHDDDARGECFRKYSNPADSYVDHSKFLTTRARYASLFSLPPTDYKKWAFGLKAAGYATNPNYAYELIKIIEEYALYRYDKKGYTKALSLQELPDEIIPTNNLLPLKSSRFYALSPFRPVYSSPKGRVFIIATAGDKLKALAKEYNLFNREIKRFNKALKKKELRSGDIVYLTK